MPPEWCSAQIEAALDDIGADAIKIGMLCNGRIASRGGRGPGDVGRSHRAGSVLLSTAAAHALGARMAWRCWKSVFDSARQLVTPNAPETQALTSVLPRQSAHSFATPPRPLSCWARGNVLFKGGHGTGDTGTRCIGRRRQGMDF